MLYRGAKKILFRMQPETAHHVIIGGLSGASKVPGSMGLLKTMYGVKPQPELSQKLWGVSFPNPVGLAAGLDKNAHAVKGFSSIGFGFMEVGTVTPKPQPGNEQPRVFRLLEDEALINRMGFNNEGAEAMEERLKRLGQNRAIPLAINIGKNKITSNEQAADDYRACIRILYNYGDFFVVNISSPNTPDLRKLQHGEELKQLLADVLDEMSQQASRSGAQRKPILVKIAPDLELEELTQIVETIAQSSVDGIIATNTTLSRESLSSKHAKETGGLSGKPLLARSTDVIRQIYKQTGGQLPIIGSGGIFTAEDAYEKIRAGASLVEVYTALIYRGPGLLKEINEGLRQLLKRDGLTHISQAVGADH